MKFNMSAPQGKAMDNWPHYLKIAMGKLAKYAAFNTFGEAIGGQEAYISFLESWFRCCQSTAILLSVPETKFLKSSNSKYETILELVKLCHDISIDESCGLQVLSEQFGP